MNINIRNFRRRLLCFGLILIATTTGLAPAQTIRVASIEGKVELANGPGWGPLKHFAEIPEKALVRTAAGARLDFEIGPLDSVFRLAEKSEIKLVATGFHDTGMDRNATIVWELIAGEISGVIPWWGAGSRFEIKLPRAVVGITSGSFHVSADGVVKLLTGQAVIVTELRSGEIRTFSLTGGNKLLADGAIVPLTEQEFDRSLWVRPAMPMAAAPPLDLRAAVGGRGGTLLMADIKPLTATAGSDPESEDVIKVVRLFYATDRKRTGSDMATKFYGGKRSSHAAPLEYGICNVTLPPNHQFARLEEYSLLRFETENDSAKHVTLKTVRPLAETNFFAELRRSVAAADHREIFVFIHGYNVSWEDSARRAAQIAYDIGIDKKRGVPLLFSWPSQGKLAAYVTDETNIRIVKLHLAQLLTNLVARSEARHINILAHSMGNQALTEALHLLGEKMPVGAPPIFNQVVLAAPDVDVDLLTEMAPAIQRTAKRFTLYSCKTDLPVRISRWFHGNHRRVGSFALISGFDTIDATLAQANGFLHHSYVGDVPMVLRDVRKLFESGCAVPERCCCCFQPHVEKVGQTDQNYWAFTSAVVTNCSHLKPCN